MNNIAHVQLIQSNVFAELKKQFEEIENLVESGETVTLDLSDGKHAISLTIHRDNVVKTDLPVEPRKPQARRKSRTLPEVLTNRFSFDIDDTNREITAGNLEAQINTARNTPDDNAESKANSAVAEVKNPTPGIPNPALRFLGENNWVLTEDCAYTANVGFSITVKKGFKTDLASVPRIFWPLVAFHDLSTAAPIVHDLIYRSGGKIALPDGEVDPPEKTFTRDEADNIFEELMVLAGIKRWKRRAAYFAVQAFASYSWRG